MKILCLFTHLCVVRNLHDFFLIWDTEDILKNASIFAHAVNGNRVQNNTAPQ